MEEWLEGGKQFLVGDSYTLADVLGTVFCGRVHMLRGTSMFGPNVKAYFERMKQRPSFHQARVVYEIDKEIAAKYNVFRNKVVGSFLGVIGIIGLAFVL